MEIFSTSTGRDDAQNFIKNEKFKKQQFESSLYSNHFYSYEIIDVVVVIHKPRSF